MIYPVRTKKTLPIHWLDRLRSARGFPTADGVDFDLFIAAQVSVSSAHVVSNDSISNPDSINTQHRTPTPSTAELTITGRRESRRDVLCFDEEQEVGLGHALCDLFVMGCEMGGTGKSSCSIVPKKKSLRKQRNPRFCATLLKGTVTNTDCYGNLGGQRSVNSATQKNGLVLGGLINTSVLYDRRTDLNSVDVHVVKPKLWRDNDEEEDLVGHSNSEVTVIDSSIEGWKVQKYLFRTKKLWKLMEKKRKSSLSGKRKGRLAGAHWDGKEEDDDSEKKKTKKVKNKPRAGKILDECARAKISQDWKPNNFKAITSRRDQGQYKDSVWKIVD